MPLRKKSVNQYATMYAMKHSHRIHHVHRAALSYPVSMHEKLYVIVLGPLAIVALMYAAYSFYPLLAPPSGNVVSLNTMLLASLYTCIRIAVAYVFAVAIAIPLALLTVSNSTLETLLLPIFDVLESIPILAIFPVVILLFIQFNFLNGAAIFILFLNMLWNIVFALVGGLKVVPKDITAAARYAVWPSGETVGA